VPDGGASVFFGGGTLLETLVLHGVDPATPSGGGNLLQFKLSDPGVAPKAILKVVNKGTERIAFKVLFDDRRKPC
jgi:hypothetical protein